MHRWMDGWIGGEEIDLISFTLTRQSFFHMWEWRARGTGWFGRNNGGWTGLDQSKRGKLKFPFLSGTVE